MNIVMSNDLLCIDLIESFYKYNKLTLHWIGKYLNVGNEGISESIPILVTMHLINPMLWNS